MFAMYVFFFFLLVICWGLVLWSFFLLWIFRVVFYVVCLNCRVFFFFLGGGVVF